MATLTPEERAALRATALGPPLHREPPPTLPITDYLRQATALAALATQPKPSRFEGRCWKL